MLSRHHHHPEPVNMLRRSVLSLGERSSRPLCLIVEDDPVARLVAWSSMYLICGADAAIACNGEEALEDVRNAEFDLILMDIEMPVLGGFATTLKIRELERVLGRARPAPIVAHTGHARAIRMADPRTFEMDGVLEKPCTVEQMEACFRRFCHDWRPAGPRRQGRRADS